MSRSHCMSFCLFNLQLKHSFFFSNHNATPVFIYSALLYYVKWCLLIHACTPLIHSLCTLWIWPKFTASLVCLLSLFKLLLILTPHIRDLTCLCSCDEKRLKQSETCCIYISGVAKWVLVKMRKSQLGEEMNKSLFTDKTGFLLVFWRSSCLNRNRSDTSVWYVVAAHVIWPLGSPEAGRGPRASTQGRYYWHHREQMAGQTLFCWVKCWDDCMRLKLHRVWVHSSLPFPLFSKPIHHTRMSSLMQEKSRMCDSKSLCWSPIIELI